MAYSAWSVVAGEQPTTAKWNLLGSNDASFNAGTGFAAGAIGAGGIGNFANNLALPTVTQNPYKFRVHLGSAQAMAGNVTARINFDTKDYDTGSNVDIVTNKGRFTAPIAGFYQFNARVGVVAATSGSRIIVMLFKNGAEYSRGNDEEQGVTSNDLGGIVTDSIQLAANDYVEVDMFSSLGLNTATGSTQYFSGYLISAT